MARKRIRPIITFIILLILGSCAYLLSQNNKLITLKDKILFNSVRNPIKINRQNLIGVWHECSMMPSGWCDHYNFYGSGNYQLFYNTMDCAKTKIKERGTWKLENDKLILTILEETLLKGGRLVKASGSCGSKQELIGATIEKHLLVTPQTQTYELKTVNGAVLLDGKKVEINELLYSGIYINNKLFWKFYSDPTASNEFPE